MENIIIKPIGVIRSPYKDRSDMPIQGKFKEDVEAYAEILDEYKEGLTDLDGFSHAIIIYHFHKCTKEYIRHRPFLEDVQHGIFAIRSPYRPNHIGISIVKVNRIEGNKLYFNEVDVFDGTPLIDIKPYVKHFDERKNIVSGWVDKHFVNKEVPQGAILKDKNND